MSKVASTSKTQANRLPAPALFVGPPSRNTSNLDLHKTTTKDSHVNFKANPSAAIPGPTSPTSPTNKDPIDALSRDNNANDPDEQPETQQFRRGRRGTAVLDAHWAALQSTLGDIELSASSSAHVFGAAHAAALEDLRKAQVELARAWGPEATDAGDQDGKSKNNGDGEDLERVKTTTSGKHTAASVDRRGSKSEEEKDMDLATKRREEGDRYFAKVKTGVQDVVTKLEAVSKAMRAVEMESREIWGEGDSSTDLSESVAS